MSDRTSLTAQACLFCHPPQDRVVDEDNLAYSLRDGFPVTPLHSLVIPRRHVPDYFALTRDELLACDGLLHRLRDTLSAADSAVEGFNIGLNIGSVAGQTAGALRFAPRRRKTGGSGRSRGAVFHPDL
jgi:ATP adenylyltransferase